MNKTDLTKQIKALAKSLGVSCSVRSTRGITRVTIKAPCPDSALDAIKALETSVAHGDIMNDTRWYSGQMITFDYSFELPANAQDQVNSILKQWENQIKRDRSNTDYRSTEYHIEKDIKETLGRAVGAVYLGRFSLWETLQSIRDGAAL